MQADGLQVVRRGVGQDDIPRIGEHDRGAARREQGEQVEAGRSSGACGKKRRTSSDRIGRT
ncbi:hypothetical protein SR39_16095 [Methylobacterium radiotolerans]|nr:hypothetical protein SR39_16095 [Methylobacterium radiotolerans]